MADIQGPVGGNFANKLGAARTLKTFGTGLNTGDKQTEDQARETLGGSLKGQQVANNSVKRGIASTFAGNGFTVPPKTARPSKPVNPVNLGKNKNGIPYYSDKPTLQEKAKEFRQDAGPANKNNQTPANRKNMTPRSQG